MVRDLIGEVVGLSPYEKRLLDMLKTGGVSSEKRMYKFAKRRVSLERIELSLSYLFLADRPEFNHNDQHRLFGYSNNTDLSSIFVL